MSHHTILRWFLSCLVIGLLVVGVGAGARADVIHYSTQVGEDVVFEDIREASATDDPPLYGPPVVSQNSLVFFPVSFNAVSTVAAPAADLTDGTLSMTIRSLQGGPIAGIRVWEMGDYSLAGIGTAATTAEVSAALFLTVTEVDGLAIAPVSFSQSMVYSPKPGGSFNLLDDAGLGRIWSGEAILDVAGALANAGIQGAATAVTLSLDNVLFASSEPASVALIAKKNFGVEVFIPEPSTVTLLIFACGLFLVRRSQPLK